MMKRVFLVFLIVPLVVAALPVAVSAQEGEEPVRTGFRPDAPPYGVRGPYTVGVMEYMIEPDSERPLPGMVYYPTANPDGAEETITYDFGFGDIAPPLNTAEGRAILDAPPDAANGPYPLVVSSHGLDGMHQFTAYLHEHLASYGFVVIAFQHAGGWMRDSLLAQTEGAHWEANIDNLVLRQLDMTRAIDYAEILTMGDGPLASVIDTEQIATLGLSYGGYTALGAAGAQLHLGYLKTFCPESIQSSMLISQICMRHGEDIDALDARLMALADVEATPGEVWPTLGDPRVDVVISLMPGATQAFGIEGLAGMTRPALIFKAGNDQVAVTEYNVDMVWDYIGSTEKTRATLEHAGHVVSGSCSPMWTDVAFYYCSDPVWDQDRAHDLIDHFVAAFLLAELYGDADATAALSPEAVQFPGITYETTGY